MATEAAMRAGFALMRKIEADLGVPRDLDVGAQTEIAEIIDRETGLSELVEALEGIMAMLEGVVPDSYFQTDSRLNAARAVLKKAGKQ